MIHINISGSYQYTQNMGHHYLKPATAFKPATAPNVTLCKLGKPAIITVGESNFDEQCALLDHAC